MGIIICHLHFLSPQNNQKVGSRCLKMDSSHEQPGQEQAPIGSTAMDTEVLKEPRGFIRCLEWLFALIAFATCANFSTSCGYEIKCTDWSKPIQVSHQINS